MIFRQDLTATLLAGAALCSGMPACAQDEVDDKAGDTTESGEIAPTPNGRGTVYEPDYFERFGPRTALDMVNEIPGFTIAGSEDGGRGLGQASQNVLINGARLSSKSESARDQLGRITAKRVVRIEILDGTMLDVPGLTGQVANIVVLKSGLSGQLRWEGALRDTRVDPEWYGGEISVSGSTGKLDFTVALSNDNRRFGEEGPVFIRDPAGVLIETQDGGVTGAFDKPTLSTNLSYGFAPDVTANLNFIYARAYFDRLESERRFGTITDPLSRSNRRRETGYEYELGGDISFSVGPGTLKLIGLERFDREDFESSVVSVFDDPAIISIGGRFTRLSDDRERIGRFEYSWPMWGGDWQLAGEAAFNTTDRVSGLFELNDSGEFEEIDFPAGTGGVSEDRYDISLSYGRQLTGKLALQTTLASEYSTLKQTGSAANQRSFQRPKGSVSLAWQASDGLDISTEISRQVGQLSFGDFLSRVDLDDGNDNAGNNDLVPEQFWELSVEANKSLGDWGSATLTVEQRWLEDIIEIVPLPGGGEGRGNIDSASSLNIGLNTTLRLDPVGIAGATFDVELQLFESDLIDPVDGLSRAFSGNRDRQANVDFRHDILGTPWAYGGGIRYERRTLQFRPAEISFARQGPVFGDVFIEHKDVFGLNVRGTYGNVLGGRVLSDRTVFDGPRTDGTVIFTEERSQRIGPIMRLTVSGNF